MGINRISIGLQAFQNDLLQKLGRTHTREDFALSIDLAKKAGFDNINIDLMFGIPTQTMEDWKESIKKIIDCDITHISCYSLKIEEGTPYCYMLNNKEIALMDDELDREMYWYAINELGKANELGGNGFSHYEISNFAKAGFQCRHNIVYWKCGSYIGFGAGAHSYFEDKRYNNLENMEKYIDAILKKEEIKENIESIDKNESIKEFVILGFRLVDGINRKEFKEKFDYDIMGFYEKELYNLLKNGLIMIDEHNVRLTKKGLDFANEVFLEFI
jgi:oxygen-independent coproporphyrinogen-3 oxidase